MNTVVPTRREHKRSFGAESSHENAGLKQYVISDGLLTPFTDVRQVVGREYKDAEVVITHQIQDGWQKQLPGAESFIPYRSHGVVGGLQLLLYGAGER